MPSIAAPASPWQHARFRWFYVSQAVSLVGSGMAPVALSFAVLESTGSASDFAAVLAAHSVTMLVCFLLGGILADRWPRAQLLIGANTVAALSQGTVAALLLTDTAPLPALILLEAINGAAAAFTLPARCGIIPQLVAPDALFRANAVLVTSQSAAKVLGPTVGGIAVVAVGGGWAIAADALSFAAAAVFLLPLRSSAGPLPQRSSETMLAGLRGGWREFRSHKWLTATVAAFAGSNLILAGAWLTLGPIIAASSVGPGAWGAALSARAIGLVVASLLLTRVPLSPPLVWALLGSAGFVIPMLALGTSVPAPWLVVAAFVGGVGAALTSVNWNTVLQQNIPPSALSRVASYDSLGSFATVPIGQLIAVPIATVAGTSVTVVSASCLYLLFCLLPLGLSSVRHLDWTSRESCPSVTRRRW